MIRALILVVLLACFGSANAQTPSCWPAQAMGTGTMAHVAHVELHPSAEYRGWALWWYCPGDFEWTHVVLTCPETQLAQCLLGVNPGTTDAAALAAKWREKVQLPALGTANEWIYILALRDHIEPGRPAPPAYIVAKNGTRPTRPAYPYVAASASAPASRGPVSTARATVTATCDCKVRVNEGRTLFCATNVERTLVAVCSKV